MNKKKNKKLKIIFIVILLALFVLLFYGIKDIYDTLNNSNGVKTLMAIDGYGYTLNENDSPYFKELFEELKEVLESDEVDEEEYATLMSKLFVVDFYSLKYAISKSDVGGIQFVYSEYQDTFTTKAKDTVYAYVKSNIYGKRDQDLPNIKNIEITNIEQKEYDGETTQDDEAYYVNLKITYDEDLDYPTTASLILVHDEEKLEVAEMTSPSNSDEED